MKDRVAMFRDSRAEGARDLFSCSIAGWRLLQELALIGGWNPLGTTYVTGGKEIEEAALRDYEPGAALDVKRIQHDDAIGWATALHLAKERPQHQAQFEAIIAAKSWQLEGSEEPPTLIDEFAQYAYGGSFDFVLGDA